jgi:hypothetical protein
MNKMNIKNNLKINDNNKKEEESNGGRGLASSLPLLNIFYSVHQIVPANPFIHRKDLSFIPYTFFLMQNCFPLCFLA